MRKTLWIGLMLSLLITACDGAPAPAAEVPETPALTIPSRISALNAASLQPVVSAQDSAGAMLCKWTGDSQRLWALDLSSARLYDAGTLEKSGEFGGAGIASVFDASTDGNTIAYTSDGQEIRLYDLGAQKDKLAFSPAFPFSGAYFSTNGSILGVESLEQIEVAQFSAADGSPAGTLNGFETAAPVYTARYSPDGETLLWWSRGIIQPMDIASGKFGAVLSHEDFVSAVAMRTDGQFIATSAGGTLEGEFQPLVTLWDAKSGAMVWQAGNDEYFNALDFSPDSSLLAAGAQSEVILYAVSSGEELARLDAGGTVNSLSFSPDGSMLLSCGIESQITIWTPQ